MLYEVITGDHGDRRGIRGGQELPQKSLLRPIRQPEVEQHEVEGANAQGLERRRRCCGGFHSYNFV